MSGGCPECGSERRVTTFEHIDYECGSRLLISLGRFVESRQCVSDQRDRARKERDDARYAIKRWANATQVVGTHRSCSCAVCEALYQAAEEAKE